MIKYVIIEEIDNVVDANVYFDTFEETREYLEKIIEERNDLFADDDDVIVFDNDDCYKICKINKNY
jgi:cell division GTPase FtsZ